jgi:hypothetical protein
MPVSIIEDHIVVNIEYEYNIPIKECNTPEKILGWARQLSEKNWMTNNAMREFLEIACKLADIKR